MSTPGTNLTLTGQIAETAAGADFTVCGGGSGGTSTLTLDNVANPYSGSTHVDVNATLAIPTISNIGANSPIGTGAAGTQIIRLGGSGRGTLLLTGTNSAYATNRIIDVFGLYADSLAGVPGGGAIEVQNAGTTLTLNGQIRQGGSFIKTGPGAVVLSHLDNTYTGGTYVEGGTLRLGNGSAIPTGGNVTVQTGAEFDTNGLSNFSSPIGTLTLNGGTFRVPTGVGDFYSLNRLAMTGGTVDFTGTDGYRLEFMNPGAGITTNPSDTTATLVQGASVLSEIQHLTQDPFPISVGRGNTPSGIDLDAGIILSASGTIGCSSRRGWAPCG